MEFILIVPHVMISDCLKWTICKKNQNQPNCSTTYLPTQVPIYFKYTLNTTSIYA